MANGLKSEAAELPDEQSILIVSPPRRHRGRPPAPEPGTTLSIWLPVSEYDRICKLAHQRDQTVSALVKSLLLFQLKTR